MFTLTNYAKNSEPYQIVSVQNKDNSSFRAFKIITQNKAVFGSSQLSFLKINGALCGFLSITLESSKLFLETKELPAESQLSTKRVLSQIIDLLTVLAFENIKCEKVFIIHMQNDLSEEVLRYCGYQQIIGNSFFITREINGLRSLSKMIQKEKHRLLPDGTNLTQSLIDRVSPIWYQYASKGINLSEGGVPHSYITLRQLSQNLSLQTFSMYRSDRDSVELPEDRIKHFLLEEGAISTSTKMNELQVVFCYGAHEGIIRVARCIYNESENNGVFWAQGSYGLLAAAFQGMAPVGYRTHLVKSDLERGEKLSLKSLEDFFCIYPRAKTLFIELKTVAGAVYNIKELTEIVILCKKHGVFLLVDAAHINLHFYNDSAFPDIISIFQELNYHEYAYVYTGSKTYGLERGRVGFIVVSQFIKSTSARTIMIDLYRNIGAGFDLPYELANALLISPLEQRRRYVSICRESLKFNMNLMLAYVESTASNHIDKELFNAIEKAIDPEFRTGIKGIKILYKPKAGVQLKIDMEGVSNLFFYNIQMFNSEIFSYALNKVMGIVTLHSYCFLSVYPYSIRLSFSFRDHVHDGMKGLYKFVGMLTDAPRINRNMPDVPDAKQYMEESLRAESKNGVSSKTINNMAFFKHSCEQKTHKDRLEHRQLWAKL